MNLSVSDPTFIKQTEVVATQYKSRKNVRQTVSLTPGDPGLFVRACSENKCTVLLPYAYLFRGTAIATRVVKSRWQILPLFQIRHDLGHMETTNNGDVCC